MTITQSTGHDHRSYVTIHVDPVTPTIGAVVEGADLGNLDDATWADIERAFAEHSVLFFRDQDLAPEPHKALGRRFGELHVHPAANTLEGHPNIMIIHADERSKFVAGNGWHTDVSCDEEPPMASILHLTTVPPQGGDTLFTSTTAAWDALSSAMKDFLWDKEAVHESVHVYAGRYGAKEVDSRDGVYPTSVHPIARTHAVTGRTALYVNRGFTTRIKGLNRAESAGILSLLYTHLESPDFQVRFRWEAGSVAIWDNRSTQHYAVWDYFPSVRYGHRVSIVGDRPYRDESSRSDTDPVVVDRRPVGGLL